MTNIINRDCNLYTLDGVFPARVTDIKYNDAHKRYCVVIKTLNGRYNMTVFDTLAKRKFEGEEIPTFYNC